MSANEIKMLGSVDIELSEFVRINSVSIAARDMSLSHSKPIACNKERDAVKRTLRAAFVGVFYSVITHLCRITTPHALCLVQNTDNSLQKRTILYQQNLSVDVELSEFVQINRASIKAHFVTK